MYQDANSRGAGVSGTDFSTETVDVLNPHDHTSTQFLVTRDTPKMVLSVVAGPMRRLGARQTAGGVIDVWYLFNV